MAHSSPLTGEYLRAFEQHATKNDPKRGGATVPCWEIVAYAADILDIAARWETAWICADLPEVWE